MTWYDNRPLTLGDRDEPRPRRVSFGPVRERLAGVFHAAGDSRPRLGGTPPPDEREGLSDEVPPQFPLARNGYDRVAVDRHIAELERELSELDRDVVELRSGRLSNDRVASELRRIGEQTSEVLISAHEQRGEILRVAREEAHRCVAEAQARARTITVETEARIRDLKGENEAAQRQRDRLLEDMRTVSNALARVVDAAQERIPSRGPVALAQAASLRQAGPPTKADPSSEADQPTEPGPMLAG